MSVCDVSVTHSQLAGSYRSELEPPRDTRWSCDQGGHVTGGGHVCEASQGQNGQRVQVKQLLFTETYMALLTGH